MDDKQVHQNESIKDGLEKFIDQQMFGLQDIPKAAQTGAGRNSSGERNGGVGTVRNDASVNGRSSRIERREEAIEQVYDAADDMDAYEDVHEDEEWYASDDGKAYGMEESSGAYGDRSGREDSSAGQRRSRADSGNGGRAGSRTGETGDRNGAARASAGGRKVSNGSGESSAKGSSNGTIKGKGKKTNGGKSEKRNTDKKAGGKGGQRSQKSKKQKKPMGKAKKVLLILLIVLLALFLWWYIMVVNVYNKMNYEKSDDIIEGSMKEDGVINILLIGNDSRENGEDGRSDAMILVSVSERTKKIYMTSLLRDMYVEIPDHNGNRLNAAYSYGGPSLLCATIEKNLGIEINRYAIVNFQAFASVVDAVGGVDLELTSEEVHWVNAYLNEYNLLEGRELTTDYLDESLSGMLHLNGPQALAYCRNRYIGTDFGRTERQRKVLSAIAKKLPMAMATNSSELINGLFPNLTTNMKQTEVYALSLNAAKYLTYDMEELTVPAEGTYTNTTIRKMMVLQVDFEANRKLLREKIYGETEEQQREEE